MIAPGPSPLPSFVEDLLREQQDLSAVERFAQDHAAVTATSRVYRSLMPATAPGPGQQYGFEVDLDRCSGCKACVTACHNMNGLDEDETWRDVGLLVGGSFSLPVMQHVTTACHHCIEPGCMSACPTLAYEKDPVTGIVKHLDDQCFGCQYCILACPYEVPKFHAKKGIVRKCDMCSSRLKAGEAPACVQACPHEAIRISLVSVDEIRTLTVASSLLVTAPDSTHTLPTTRYVTARGLPRDVRSGDESQVHPEHNHPPLVIMLVLSQVSVGLMLAGLLAAMQLLQSAAFMLTALAWTSGLIASLAATAHLGRPWLAYRAFLGWRTSWLSREIMIFGAYQGLAGAAFTLVWWPAEWMSQLTLGVMAATVVVGVIGVYCSVKIYAVTPRPFWTFRFTAVRFFGTSILAAALASGMIGVGGPWAFVIASMMAFGKLVAESRQRHAITENRWAERSVDLLYGPLRDAWFLRCSTLMFAGVVGPAVIATLPEIPTAFVVVTVVGCLVSEFIERGLFFRAAAAPRMPGGLAA